MKTKQALSSFIRVFALFIVPFVMLNYSCIDVDDHDDEDDPYEEETPFSTKWEAYAQIAQDNNVWGHFHDQNIEVGSDGNVYVLFKPQYSSQGGINGYASVISEKNKYENEEFTSSVSGTFNMIETDMHNNIPYACYFYFTDGKSKLNVAKRSGNTWSTIGGEIVPESCDDDFSFSVAPNGNLFVAYGAINDIVFEKVGTLSVREYNGSSWSYVGEQNVSGTLVSSVQIAVGSNNQPFVFYREVEGLVSKMAVVKYFNGNAWESIGRFGSETGSIDNMQIVVKGNTPYITYTYGSNNNFESAIKYWDGSTWKDAVNEVPIMGRTKLLVYKNDVYVAYRNANDNRAVYVQKIENNNLKSFDVEGLRTIIMTTDGTLDFKISDKGIFLLDGNSSRVVHYPL